MDGLGSHDVLVEVNDSVDEFPFDELWLKDFEEPILQDLDEPLLQNFVDARLEVID